MKLAKQDVFELCLENGGVAQVHLQPSPTLAIPFQLDARKDTVFEYGHHMPNPIPDLKWTNHGIHATLSFGGVPHETFVPWDSVLAVEPQGGDAVVVWRWRENASTPKATTASGEKKSVRSKFISVVK